MENLMVRDANLVARFLDERGKQGVDHMPITFRLEHMSGQFAGVLENDVEFVKTFNRLVASNKDAAILLAHHLLGDYDVDDLGTESQQRLRLAFEEAVSGADNQYLPEYFRLVKNVTGRMVAGRIADKDRKWYELVKNLVDNRGKDVEQNSMTVLGEIENDMLTLVERQKS